MQIIDATPPTNFPAQVIVAQDAAFAERHPHAAYYLRVKGPDNAVDVHQLPGAIGGGHARQMARAMGFDPTHWTMPGDGRPYLF